MVLTSAPLGVTLNMMKLKHLIDNRELALYLLQHWGYDQNRREVLDQFRISANAIYPFYREGELLFLRFAPLEEKPVEFVKSELEFMEYLRHRGLGVAKPVPTQNGEALLQCSTPWGDYAAVVFTRAKGQRADRITGNDKFYYLYGKSLGRLHALSGEYTPKANPRPDWAEQLSWMEGCLTKCNAPMPAIREAKRLREELSCLPQTTHNYGLVHYDYELDNVFYDADSESITVIDFDDAHYHWFAMDVVATLNNLEEELAEADVTKAQSNFLEGYRSEMDYPDALRVHEPLFMRYGSLFKYTRCMRSAHEPVANEPEWMTGLRKHLADIMSRLERSFGC